MRVVIRVDSGKHIGTGHLSRCLTLANALTERGANVHFVTRAHTGFDTTQIISQGHQISVLKPGATAIAPSASSSSWLGVEWEIDAEETLKAIGSTRRDVLVVDHYGLDARWEERFQGAFDQIVVIDDLANRPHKADVLLDQNWFGPATASRYDGLLPLTARSFLGPSYALLQPRYHTIRRTQLMRRPALQRALIYFGSTDATNESLKALQAFCSEELLGWHCDVVLGPMHPDRVSVESLAQERGRTIVHQPIGTLADLLATAGITIGAGGATTWERLCLNVPSVVAISAENQRELTLALAEAGYLVTVGSTELTTSESYRQALWKCGADSGFLAPLVDGLGTTRVVEALWPTDASRLTLRPAELADATILFHWRNEPSTRSMSLSQDELSWPAHQSWLRNKLANQSVLQLIMLADGLPVGQARFDIEDAVAWISFSLDPIVRGRGWGQWLLDAAVKHFSADRPVELRAKVKAENHVSRNSFLRAGWQLDSIDGDIITFTLPLP